MTISENKNKLERWFLSKKKKKRKKDEQLQTNWSKEISLEKMIRHFNNTNLKRFIHCYCPLQVE